MLHEAFKRHAYSPTLPSKGDQSPANRQQLSCGSYVSSGTPIPVRVRNEMAVKMQKHGDGPLRPVLYYDEPKLGCLHVALPPNPFRDGRTWAPSPLSFPVCNNDDGFEEGEIIDIAMPIHIPTRRPLVGPRSPLSAVR
jgi:hypothetical protein